MVERKAINVKWHCCDRTGHQNEIMIENEDKEKEKNRIKIVVSSFRFLS